MWNILRLTLIMRHNKSMIKLKIKGEGHFTHVDMMGVVSNRTVRVPSPLLVSETTGMLPSATRSSGT